MAKKQNTKSKKIIINIAAVAVGAGIGTLLTACGNSFGDSGTSSAGNNGRPSSVSQSDGVVIKQDYDMSAISFQDVAFTYDGNPHEILIQGDLPEGVLVSYYGNGMTNAGVYTVTAQFQGDATLYNAIPSMTATLTINKAEVKGITFEDKTYEYDGDPKSIEITGSLPSGVSVTYSVHGMIPSGEYTVVAQFYDATGNYQVPEDMTATLTIKKAKVDVPHLEQPSFTYDGKEHEVSILGLDDSLMTITGTRRALDAGAYMISVFLNDRENYEWSDSSFDGTLRWNILPSGLGAISFDNQSFTYDGEEQFITINGDLPEGVTVSYSNNGQVNVGSYQVVAHFTDNTGENYVLPEDMTATLTINKAKVDVPSIETSSFPFDGEEHEVSILGLDDSLMTITGTRRALDAGAYMISVSLKDRDNHEWSDSSFDGTLSWSIVKDGAYHYLAFKDGETFLYEGWVSDGTYLSYYAPSLPTKDGYNSSWDADINGNLYEDTVIHVVYTAIQYEIIYMLDGGTYDGPTTYTIEDDDIVLGTPTKDCYDFVGWYTDPTFETPIQAIASGSTGEIALYAKYEPSLFIVYYDGDEFISTSKIDRGSRFTFPESYDKDGKTLVGWMINGERYNPGKEYDLNFTEDVTATALFAVVNDQVTWESNWYTGEITVTGLADKSITNLVIPEYVKDSDGWFKEVTGIGGYAFYNCSSLTSVTIGNSVTSIGYSAFSGCSSLKRVDITDMTKWCQIDFADSGSNPLYYAHSLWLNGSLVTSIDFQGITEVKNYTFYNCSPLTRITIPDSVTSIGYSAFYGCSSLTSVTIGNSVTSIGSYAFSGCTSLTSVTMGNSVTSIGKSAFVGCSSLKRVDITDMTKWCQIDFANSESNPLCSAHSLWLNGSLVTSIDFQGITEVKDYAFYNCSPLTSVVIPDSVTSIGSYAFEWCSSLTSITIPDSVTSIGGSAFYGCSSLKRVDITDMTKWCQIDFAGVSSNPLYYAGSLWLNGSLVTSIDFQGITEVKNYAFYNCSPLTSVTIGNSVTSIGESAFSGCTSLTSVTIPDSVTSIGYSAFFNCSSLTNVTIGNSVTSIGDYAFRGCSSLTNVTIGNSVTSIGYAAFGDCSSLKRVDITDMTKWCQIDFNYDSNPLSYAHSLWLNGSLVTSIDLQGITEVKDYAFYGCASLTSVTIPDSVTSIGTSAFSGCSSLKRVDITDMTKWCQIDFADWYSNPLFYAGSLWLNGSLVTSIDFQGITEVKKYAFYGCTSLTSVTISDGVTSIGSSAFDCCSSLTSVTIPDSVTSIGTYAFDCCSSLTSVTIGNSVTSIGNYAFRGCTSLTSVVIPDNVTSIGDYAFLYCSSLTNVTIGNSVTSIGTWAFWGCTSLTSVVIPDNVTSIGYEAFYNCSSLTSVTIGDSVTFIGSNAFDGCYRLAVVYNLSNLKIVKGSSDNGYVAYYAKAVYTSLSETSGLTIDSDGFAVFDDGTTKTLIGYFGAETDVTIPSDIDVIGSYAFRGCTSLTSVVIPNSVTSIGESAFYDCSSLISVTIGNSVTSIGKYAFYNCSSLTSVVIPYSVTSIGYSAFDGCYRLAVVYNLSNLNIEKGSSSNGYVARYAKAVYTSLSETSGLTIDSDGFAVLDEGTTKTLIGYFGAETDLALPSDIDVIGDYAFYNCTSLTNVSIGNSVTFIGSYAFSGCTSLTSVTIGNSVTSIGSSAFSDCSSLKRVDITDMTKWCQIDFADSSSNPLYYAHSLWLNGSLVTSIDFQGITEVKNYAFYGCSSLTSVTIGDRVTSIGSYAFSGCTSLTSVVIPDSVTSIGESAFRYCSSLTSVVIPNSVTSIGEYGFCGCSHLKSVVLPQGLKRIENGMFSGTSLSEITIPSSVTFIGNWAFSLSWDSTTSEITYEGTMEQWNNIALAGGWGNKIKTVHCTDGDVSVNS